MPACISRPNLPGRHSAGLLRHLALAAILAVPASPPVVAAQAGGATTVRGYAEDSLGQVVRGFLVG